MTYLPKKIIMPINPVVIADIHHDVYNGLVSYYFRLRFRTSLPDEKEMAQKKMDEFSLMRLEKDFYTPGEMQKFIDKYAPILKHLLENEK